MGHIAVAIMRSLEHTLPSEAAPSFSSHTVDLLSETTVASKDPVLLSSAISGFGAKLRLGVCADAIACSRRYAAPDAQRRMIQAGQRYCAIPVLSPVRAIAFGCSGNLNAPT